LLGNQLHLTHTWLQVNREWIQDAEWLLQLRKIEINEPKERFSRDGMQALEVCAQEEERRWKRVTADSKISSGFAKPNQVQWAMVQAHVDAAIRMKDPQRMWEWLRNADSSNKGYNFWLTKMLVLAAEHNVEFAVHAFLSLGADLCHRAKLSDVIGVKRKTWVGPVAVSASKWTPEMKGTQIAGGDKEIEAMRLATWNVRTCADNDENPDFRLSGY
jgi:hypothetical protein